MKLDCTATSAGSSLVLPPSPVNVFSPIASFLQAAIAGPFMTHQLSHKHKSSLTQEELETHNNIHCFSNTTNCTSFCSTNTPTSNKHNKYNNNNYINDENTDSDDSYDNYEVIHNSEHNYNHKYNSITKRKWESTTDFDHHKYKKQTDSRVPTSVALQDKDEICSSYFTSDFVFLETECEVLSQNDEEEKRSKDDASGENKAEDEGLSIAVRKEGDKKRLLVDGADFRQEEDDEYSGDSSDLEDDDDIVHLVIQSQAHDARADSDKAREELYASINNPPSIAQEGETSDVCIASVAQTREEEFNPFIFIKNLPPKPNALSTSSPVLPPRLSSAPPFTLVLDLDETLVHCSTEEMAQPDLVFPVTFNQVDYTVFARKRPHIQEFLKRVSPLFEVVVFTASQEVYADKLLNILDPDGNVIKHRLFRDSCLCVEGNYLKDLSMLGRDLSKVVIVDNSPQAFGYHIDNGIPIESWFDDEHDEELMSVLLFLESLLVSDDVRPLIREKYKLHEQITRA